ncbi:cyclic nucleotide-binding protein [Ectocarpus siliculosus]|uniref:Cyclic nucleotide-binding protein n=1 Tax=Ectocarpus siliculosus TaxID=2880 RepID=D7FHU8_ECTSI|nr:cyclic nucleotide-binding protein [Ectocarpus siliculosus]|eukprot:CBJ34146.1 cyclic nucleotide-binding protein [Ectocarpus siliculosus]
MYRRLMFIFELASNFISAHEDVDILELLHEGPVAYQLALEKNRQLQDARSTLSQQLPVFPELARSLKTRVAAKYMLVQHPEVVHELFHHGHINDRESEGLIAENNAARVKLEYHPAADQIPDRFTLLKNVPFLRFLTDEEKAEIINNEKACQEEFYGSNVVLMNAKMSFARGARRQGWFNVVRGAVRQNTEGMLGHTTMGGTQRLRRLAKERLVNAGTVVGLDEQLMQVPYRCTYTTASFVHLFFFDKTQTNASAVELGKSSQLAAS